MGVRFPLPAPSISFIYNHLRINGTDLAKSVRYKYGTMRIPLIFNTLKIYRIQPMSALYM